MIPHVAAILLTQFPSDTARPSSSLGSRCLTGGASSSLSRRSFSLLWRSRHRADRVERARDLLSRWFFAALIASALVFVGLVLGMIVDLPLAREAAL